MAIKKAGAPEGNTNSAKGRPWTAALQRELTGNANAKKLRALAKKLYDMALEGNTYAMKEIGDRLEGKAIQQVEQTVEVSGTIQHTVKHSMNFGQVLEQRDKLKVIEHAPAEQVEFDGE